MNEKLAFKNRALFRSWLQKNHARPQGVWLVFGKHDAIKTLSPEEALEEALCFGWIDGLIKRVDEKRYVKFFSPRRAKSSWSEKNRRTAEKLIESGRMAAPGRQAIENARRAGSWTGPGGGTVTPEDFERFTQMISAYPQASANLQKMPPYAKKQFAGYFLDAKQEATRQRRLEKIVAMLEQNKKPMM